MAEPFLSEIRIFSFNFPPRGWAHCSGQLMAIGQNQALFSLLGTTFGGDGLTIFALPDYRGRVPMHRGNGHTIGERAGQEVHTLTISELPTHNHSVKAIDNGSTASNVSNPAGNSFSNSKPANLYQSSQNNVVPLSQTTVSNTGGNQPHVNMQPFLTVNFCIALQGIFPSTY